MQLEMNITFRTDVDIGGPSYVRLARLDVQNPATRDTTQEPEGRDGFFIRFAVRT